MPSHDRFNDDTMSRDRSDYGRRERGSGEYGDRDSGAFFDRNERESGRDRDRERNRPIGGWGGLMDEDRTRYTERERDRDRLRSERRYGSDDNNSGVPMDETQDLIASNKVEGTPVYDRHGDKLGSIHNFMVHKTKGHVVYAVLKHGGGFLGLNERYYPLEWNQLDYDTRLGGYHTKMDEDDLKSFGSFDSQGRWQSRSMSEPSDRDNGRESGRYGRERSTREPW